MFRLHIYQPIGVSSPDVVLVNGIALSTDWSTLWKYTGLSLWKKRRKESLKKFKNQKWFTIGHLA
jgi:hypothetical protein